MLSPFYNVNATTVNCEPSLNAVTYTTERFDMKYLYDMLTDLSRQVDDLRNQVHNMYYEVKQDIENEHNAREAWVLSEIK